MIFKDATQNDKTYIIETHPEEYDEDNPNAFFTYNLSIFYSMIKEIDYEVPFQIAKAKLYGLEYRTKMFYDTEFEIIAAKLNAIYSPNTVSCQIDKDDLIKFLEVFKIDTKWYN